MSAVASSPSTPGRASAVTSRSSSSVRLAMAVALPPAPRAPRAGWSQAMIISLPSGRTATGAAGWPAAGGSGRGRSPGPRSARRSRRRTRPVAHSVGDHSAHLWPALANCGPGSAGRSLGSPPASRVSISARVGIAVSTRAGRRRSPRPRSRTAAPSPAASRHSRPWQSEPPNESPAPSPFIGVIAIGGDPRLLSVRSCQHAARALLDHGQLDAGGQQRVGRPLRVGLTGRDLALLAVAHGHGDLRQDPLHLLPGRLGAGPEHRPVVQVEHGERLAGAGLQHGVVRRPGSAPRSARRPTATSARWRVRRRSRVVRAHLHVGSGRPAVEVQREVVRREDLAEGDGRGVLGVGDHEPVVDPELAQRAADEAAERVVADPGDDGGPRGPAGRRPPRRWPWCRRGTCRRSGRPPARRRSGAGRCPPRCGRR